MEDVGEVQVLLSRDVGQVGLGLVDGLGQAEFRQVFLKECKTVAQVTQLVVDLLPFKLLFVLTTRL